ncbi:MAG: YqaE/Pmp3 family membrane protein [Magnetovibrio sp.]|nr:YqaE/Pmp3 family membrane protein [Magnetovibrio sp.]
MLRILIAIFLPFVLFFTIGRPISAIICLILQVLFFGGALFTAGLSLTVAWVPSLWALLSLMKYKSKDD